LRVRDDCRSSGLTAGVDTQIMSTVMPQRLELMDFVVVRMLGIVRMPGSSGMVGATGIEPVTPSMSTRCSPAELRAL
jgi:hypothetical protein